MNKKQALVSLALAAITLTGCNSTSISDKRLEDNVIASLENHTFSSTFSYQEQHSPYTIEINSVDFTLEKQSKFHLQGTIDFQDERLKGTTPIEIYGTTKIKQNRPSGTLYMSKVEANQFDVPQYHGIAYNRIHDELLSSLDGLLKKQLTGMVVADFKDELNAYEENGVNLNNYRFNLSTENNKLIVTSALKGSQ